MVQNWIVDWSTARDFTVSKNYYNRIYDLYCNGFLVSTLLPITLCIFLLYLAKAGIAIASPTPHPPFRRLCTVFIKSGEPSTPLGLINELKAIKFIFDLMTNHKLVKLFTLVKVQVFWKDHKNMAHLPLFIWHYLVSSNYKWKMGQIFVAFSEYLNFKLPWVRP